MEIKIQKGKNTTHDDSKSKKYNSLFLHLESWL